MGSSSFLFQHVYPIRLLEAAELLEADQRKHEGGHSKETSAKGFSLEINDFPIPADSGRSPRPAVALQINSFLKDFN